MPAPLDSVRDELATIAEAGLTRTLLPFEGAQKSEIALDGRRLANFSSNNYLGLADHPLLIAAAQSAMAEHGFGSGAARLIVGNLAPHRAIERRIALWKGTDAALLFNSGYQANVGMVSALAGPEDVVFSDAYNHASLIDGCRLSRARIHVYRHLDLADLATALAHANSARRRLIVTDSVFSMDGDRAPLGALADLALRHNALLAVDEAHAVGVLGPDGAGLSAGLDIPIRMGTLGKALGAFGAYIAGPRAIVELLMHRARSFVFTTALPVPVVAAATAAIDYLTSDPGRQRRALLAARVDQFDRGLAALHLPRLPCPSHIVPLRVVSGAPDQAVAASRALRERGIFAHAIRPPTVPTGSSRVRFSIMATHSDSQIDVALRALGELRALFESTP